MSSVYGQRIHPVTGELRPHWGVDLAAPRGRAVRAADDAVVRAVARTPEYGLRVDLDHANGFVTRYAHLSAVLVGPGEAVRGGQPIGRVGASGRVRGPHLHYEVYYRGRSRDPLRFLRAPPPSRASAPAAPPDP